MKESIVSIVKNDIKAPTESLLKGANQLIRSGVTLASAGLAKVLLGNIKNATETIAYGLTLDNPDMAYRLSLAMHQLTNFDHKHVIEGSTGYEVMTGRVSFANYNAPGAVEREVQRAQELGSHVLNYELTPSSQPDWTDLATDRFTPGELTSYALVIPGMWGADIGLRYFAQNHDNAIANLFNRPIGQLNHLELGTRLAIDGLVAAATIGSISGIIEGIS